MVIPMSWQSYIDTQLIASGYVSDATILCKKTGSSWANTTDFHLRKYKCAITCEDMNEADVIVNEADDISSFCISGKVPTAGLRVNGQRYRVLKVVKGTEAKPFGECVVYGIHKIGGICMVATKKIIIICIYNTEVDPTFTNVKCNQTCETLGKYLFENGF